MDALKTPSFFGKAKRREILHVLTYRTRPDNEVVSTRGPLVTQICADLHPACATLGDLEPLPLELFNEILHYSDLQAASAFRSLNRRARAVVKSSFYYKLILLNAPQALGALEKTGICILLFCRRFIPRPLYAFSPCLRTVWNLPVDSRVRPMLFPLYM